MGKQETFTALATLIEYLLEAVLTGIVLPEKYAVVIKRGLSFVLGILIALVFNFDVTNEVGLTPVTPVVGLIATGILLGLGSNVLHIFLGGLSKLSKTRLG